MTLLLLGLAAAAGAVTRFLLDRAVQGHSAGTFPWGTWVVNVTGSFALGVLLGLSPTDGVLLVLGTGFLGAYTTFSTFAVQTLRLAQEGAPAAAAANVAMSVTAGLLAAVAGMSLAS